MTVRCSHCDRQRVREWFFTGWARVGDRWYCPECVPSAEENLNR